MSARACVLCSVAIWRVVTAQRRAARLTGPKMNPLVADLQALFAFPPLRMFDAGNRADMRASFSSHCVLLFVKAPDV